MMSANPFPVPSRRALALPTPRTPDPMASPPLRWGILAPGRIAGSFAAAAAHTRQRVFAVASRDRDRAEAFAARFGVPVVHDSYLDLVSDPRVQAVYVCSPHSLHHPLALMAIRAGKHVLVEKPLTVTAEQARELAAEATTRGSVLMEAMKTRFMPRTDIVRQLLLEGRLGELEWFRADHGRRIADVPRLTDPTLGGGALLDLGSYAVAYAVFVLGVPTEISAVGFLTESGVDRQVGLTMRGFSDHPDALAQVHATMAAETPRSAEICGTEAWVELKEGFYGPGTVRLVTTAGREVEMPDLGLQGHDAMAYELAHFATLVADGRLESPLMPLGDSIAGMEVMDAARRLIGAH